MSSSIEGSQRLIRAAAAALVAGGLLAALLNLILTPLLPVDAGSVAVAGSTVLAVRLSFAAASVALVSFGVVGLWLAQSDRLRLGTLAFVLAGVGGLMAFCVECVQFTLVRDLALEAPDVLERLEDAGELSRYDLGFGIAVGTFTLGWLLVAVVTWRVGLLPRRGPGALLLGMVLVPLLGALAGLWGVVAGNVVLGFGWALLGLDLARTNATAELADPPR